MFLSSSKWLTTGLLSQRNWKELILTKQASNGKFSNYKFAEEKFSDDEEV